jgi:hypothetical protein
MRHKLMCLLIAAVAGLVVPSVSASAARETIPYRWKNCTIVNKRFPHGVGKLQACSAQSIEASSCSVAPHSRPRSTRSTSAGPEPSVGDSSASR